MGALALADSDQGVFKQNERRSGRFPPPLSAFGSSSRPEKENLPF